MEKEQKSEQEKNVTVKVLETVIQIGLVTGLIVWCFLILRPFIMIALWGLIIAVAVYPQYERMKSGLGNRKKLTAILVTAVILLIILIPVVFMGKTLYEGINSLKGFLGAENYTLPPPPEYINDWPLIGKPLFKAWQSASLNLTETIMQFKPQIKGFLTWFIGSVTEAGVGAVKFIISIIVSGFFLILADSGGKFVHEFSVKIAGERGPGLVISAGVTIRSVTRGILGVALIQSILIGIGFAVAGIPGAGLWTLLCFLLGVIQIGPFPVIIGVLIYVFLKATTFTAIALTVWCILIGPVDNILKPIMLGRGSKSPMLVIFLGSIGGFMLSGIIGLFVGAVILSLGYNLFLVWLREIKEVG